MFKFFKNRKFFRIYKKNIIKNQDYLLNKYALEINFWYELYATINLGDSTPEMVQKYGSALHEFEIKKYISALNSDLAKLELDELLKTIEIKKLDQDNYGIAFGFALQNNRSIIKTNIVLYSIIAVLTIGLGIFLI